MNLSIHDVSHIAKLARLELSEDEKINYAEQLSVVFEYIKMLDEVDTDEVDTDGVEETCQVTGLQDVVREDVVVESDQKIKDKIKLQFPESDGDLLKVKEVFE